jgi:PHD/YefM family antitoxin component YafN of YafNO toxin-antitoxin module
LIKIKKAMIHHLPITKARVNLGQVVRRAHVNKEYFILEKDGIPVAGLMGADELEDYLELQDPAIRRQIAESNADIAAGRVRPASEFLAELKRMKAAKPRRPAKR